MAMSLGYFFGDAVSLAGELRASGVRVTLVVHEHKRLARALYLLHLSAPVTVNTVADLRCHAAVIAADGKTLRGSRTPDSPAIALPAAMDHTGSVLAQRQVAITQCPLWGAGAARASLAEGRSSMSAWSARRRDGFAEVVPDMPFVYAVPGMRDAGVGTFDEEGPPGRGRRSRRRGAHAAMPRPGGLDLAVGQHVQRPHHTRSIRVN
jgi:hypothetical protein